MWAPALFVQDDTLHIHSSTSRQTSTDLGSLPVCAREKMRKRQFRKEWWNAISCLFLGGIYVWCVCMCPSRRAAPASCSHNRWQDLCQREETLLLGVVSLSVHLVQQEAAAQGCSSPLRRWLRAKHRQTFVILTSKWFCLLSCTRLQALQVPRWQMAGPGGGPSFCKL